MRSGGFASNQLEYFNDQVMIIRYIEQTEFIGALMSNVENFFKTALFSFGDVPNVEDPVPSRTDG